MASKILFLIPFTLISFFIKSYVCITIRLELEDLKQSVSAGRVARQARRDSEAKVENLILPHGPAFPRWTSFQRFKNKMCIS